ncbi:hypothetical protein HF959_08255 [Pediococcus argentinicus]|nr:hypothetical protein [Pediococcus argentinicus]
MLKVYEEYHGTQLTLPSHMYERNAAAKLVRKEYDGTNSVELSHKYGYSQKWVMRQIRNI